MRPTSGTVRFARAGVLGGLSLLLAVGAHVLGGGQVPAAGVLLVSALLLGLGAAVVTRRRCGPRLLVPLLMVQQVLLHELFSVAAAAGGCTSSAVVAHGGHLASVCVGGSGAAMAVAAPTWLMWSAHLLATVATAWLLARGEAWLWRAVDRVGAAAGLGRSTGVPAGRVAPARTPLVVPTWTTTRWAPAGPRGPPVVVAG